MIFDSHVNITDDGRWFNTPFDASLERLQEEMKSSGTKRCLLIAMPFAASNNYIANIIHTYPDQFYAVGNIDFSADIASQIDNLLDMGFLGVKIHPRMQKVDLCNPAMKQFWQKLNDRRAVVMVDGYLQLIGKGIYISQIMPLAYEPIVDQYENLKFILSHAGCHHVMDVFYMCRSYPNFYTDISYSISVFKQTSFYSDYQYLITHTDQKILYGSDFPEISMNNAYKDFEFLCAGMSDEKIENICYRNAERLFLR